MMKLFYSVNSPYARMVRILAIEKGIADRIEMIAVNSLESPAELLAVNPLSKVPALVTEEGIGLCDSSAICDYLDRSFGTPLISRESPEYFRLLADAVLAKGAIDAAVALVVQGRLPAEQRSPLWKQRHENAISRTLEVLANQRRNPDSITLNPDSITTNSGSISINPDSITLADITLAALLAYLNFRHPEQAWVARHPALSTWLAAFSKRPSMQATQPVG